MKEATRDFVAVELLVLLATVLSSIVLMTLLSNLGIALSMLYVGAFLYLCRWVWWAMQYCRARPHLHRVARRLIGWSAAMLCLIGVAITLIGLSRVGLRVGIAGLALIVVGVGLIAWMSTALKNGERSQKSDEPPCSLPQHQDV